MLPFVDQSGLVIIDQCYIPYPCLCISKGYAVSTPDLRFFFPRQPDAPGYSSLETQYEGLH